MIRLSIITINLNNDAGLAKTLASVAEQTFKLFELIIIDGGSTDDSVETIRANQPIISYWSSEPDNGIYHAMNKGLRQATGEYCLFLNSGDWLSSSTILEDLFNLPPSADIVAGDVYFYDTKQQQIRWLVPSPEVLTAKTLFNGTLPHQATLIRRSLFERIGHYNETLKIASDWLFWVEALLEHHATYQHFARAVSYFNMDGISCNPATDNLPIREKQEILLKKYPRFTADYQLLESLEQQKAQWESSYEHSAYQLMHKTGMIKLALGWLKVNRYFKKRL